jgi:hypothetical protein
MSRAAKLSKAAGGLAVPGLYWTDRPCTRLGDAEAGFFFNENVSVRYANDGPANETNRW